MRSPDYFVLVAPVIKTFGRARRKNYGRWSFLPRSRQSLKQFPQRSHTLVLNQSKQNSGRLKLVLRPRQSQTLSVEKNSVGGPRQSKKDLVALRTKTFRSAFIFASFAPFAKMFGRATRRKILVGIRFCIGCASRKNFWSCQSQKFSVAPVAKISVGGNFASFAPSLKQFRQRSQVHPLNQSQQIFGWRTLVPRLAPVAKTFGRARHKKTSVGCRSRQWRKK